LDYSRKVIFSVLVVALLGMIPLAHAEVGDFILSFDGTGGTPFAGLTSIAVDSNDRIIVGDADEAGFVEIFDSTGTFVVALSGGAALSSPNAIAVDSNDFIYVLGSSVVNVYNPTTGVFTGTSFNGGQGSGAIFSSPKAIAIDSNDRVIVIDAGTVDLIQIYDTSGTFLDSFDGDDTPGGESFEFAEAVAVDSNDRIIVGDSDISRDNVQIFTSSGTFVVALSGPTTPAPNSIAVDDNDRILVGENSNDLVQVYDSTGSFQSSFDGSQGLGTAFVNIDGVTVDSNNRIIVADGATVQIYEGFPLPPILLTAVWDDVDNGDGILSAGDTLTLTFDSATNRPGGTGTLAKGIVDNLFTFSNSIGTDYTGIWTSTTVFTITIVDASGATASVGDSVSAKGTLVFTGTLDTTGGTVFETPWDISTNSTDFIFVVDGDNANVQIFNPDGTFGGTLDTTGGTPFSIPGGIGINSTDFIFVDDEGEGVKQVQIFNPDGTYSGVNLTGGTAFDFPAGITTNSTDFIFVSDSGLQSVQIFNPDGTYSGVNLDTAGGTPFVMQIAIGINSTDYIFVGDEGVGAKLVQIFNPDGTYSGVNLDTTGGTAFSIPSDIATNSTDFIFVTDIGTGLVQIFNPDGTFAGIVDTTGGITFQMPEGIATNSKDDLIVGDITSNNVQIFSQGIRDSTSTSLSSTGQITTTGNFGDVPCTIETAANVDTIISTNCIVTLDVTAGGSVRVENGAVMTIPSGRTLDINFASKNLTVESGSGVLIESGGTIT